MRRASTSRPESVSSSTATFGRSSDICRISWRFFSPPEKPSLTLRSANVGSISRSVIAVLTSLTHLRIGGASPRTAGAAVRRKFEVDTPGISTGYCMARNKPARARASTVMASTSSPSRVTVPEVTWYFGWPASEYANVDLPEPFGPMIAWVSPELTVRSTPRRISCGPSSVCTETCRSRISRVAIWDSRSLLGLAFCVCRRCFDSVTPAEKRSDADQGELVLDGLGGPLDRRFDLELVQHLAEEATYHQSAGDPLGNATGQQ